MVPTFLEFYRLREQPFGVTPDPAYLYLSRTHREALASLSYGIKADRARPPCCISSWKNYATLRAPCFYFRPSVILVIFSVIC